MHQEKKQERESQISVLELDNELYKERQCLSELCKTRYKLAGENEAQDQEVCRKAWIIHSVFLIRKSCSRKNYGLSTAFFSDAKSALMKISVLVAQEIRLADDPVISIVYFCIKTMTL